MSDIGQPDGGNPDAIYAAPTSNTSQAAGDDLLSVYLGPKNADYYLRLFADFERTGRKVSWNWPAFFIASFWLLYRKMWGLAALYWFVLPLAVVLVSVLLTVAIAPELAGVMYYLISWTITFILVPMYANWLYYRHVKKKIDRVTAAVPEGQQAIEVARAGGTSNAAGIAVAVVFFGIIIVGVLAAIAIPAYQDYTIRAQVSEGLNLSAGAKAAVTEYYQDTGRLPADNDDAGLVEPGAITGNYVSSVEVIDGEIVVTYGNAAHSALVGSSLVMSPDSNATGQVAWVCQSFTIADKHLPAACRQ